MYNFTTHTCNKIDTMIMYRLFFNNDNKKLDHEFGLQDYTFKSNFDMNRKS